MTPRGEKRGEKGTGVFFRHGILQKRLPSPFLGLAIVAVWSVGGCAAGPAGQAGAPLARRFELRDITLEIVQETSGDSDALPTKLTLTNTSRQPVAVVEFTTLADSPTVLLESKEFSGRYFYHRGRLGVAPVDEEGAGRFVRASLLLLAGQSATVEHAFPDFASTSQGFLVRVLTLSPRDLHRQVFLPAEVKGTQAFLAVGSVTIRRSRAENVALTEVVCSAAGKTSGLRCRVGGS